MDPLSRIFVEYEDVSPFSKAKETADISPWDGQMDGLLLGNWPNFHKAMSHGWTLLTRR